MSNGRDRFEGETNARLSRLEVRTDATEKRLMRMELLMERSKGWLEGSKATTLFFGTAIGAAISALLEWLVKK